MKSVHVRDRRHILDQEYKNNKHKNTSRPALKYYYVIEFYFGRTWFKPWLEDRLFCSVIVVVILSTPGSLLISWSLLGQDRPLPSAFWFVIHIFLIRLGCWILTQENGGVDYPTIYLSCRISQVVKARFNFLYFLLKSGCCQVLNCGYTNTECFFYLYAEHHFFYSPSWRIQATHEVNLLSWCDENMNTLYICS